MYMLGLMSFNGDGVPRDVNKALSWWQKAADEHHPEAQYLLGCALMEGKLGLEQDTAAGVAMLEKAANGGCIPASVYLGKVYAKGMGVPSDLEKAMKWYEQAAAGGNAHAQYIIGLAYLEGSGVSQNSVTGAHWIRMAAGQDHVNAMLVLSVCYSTGNGVGQNADLAEVWKKKAFEIGKKPVSSKE
jgi:TPR repeat protein